MAPLPNKDADRDAAKGAAVIDEPPVTLLTRRNFFRVAGLSAAALAVYSGEIARHSLEVREVNVAIRRLPDAFAGMRIVQISDIHFQEYTEAYFLQTVVRQVNALRPEMVVLTGDFVSARPLPVRWDAGLAFHCAQILRGIECPLRYAILGNHDAKAGARMVQEALETHHLPVLADAFVPLERDGQRIWLAGLQDALEQHPDVAAAMPPKRQLDREPLILLAHEPDYLDRLEGRPIDLVLSGHTHGGQVRFPFSPPLWLPALGRKYVHGLFGTAAGIQLYVNRGIGTVGLPFRLRCPPEVTVLTLSRA
jgi:uncharacterized protein